MRAAWIAETLPASVDRWLKHPSLPCPTGQFAWLKALGIGRDDIFGRGSLARLADYDIAFFTGHSGTWHWIREMREWADKSDTVLFGTADYALGAGGLDETFAAWPRCIEELDYSHVVYSVEPYQQRYLNRKLKSKVHAGHHPVDIEGIRAADEAFWTAVTKGGQKPSISTSVVLHPYGHWRADYPIDYAYLADIAGPDSALLNCPREDQARAKQHFSEVIYFKRFGFEGFLSLLSQSDVVLDLHSVPSMGRVALECAVLKVPVITPAAVNAPVYAREPVLWDYDSMKAAVKRAQDADPAVLESIAGIVENRHSLEKCKEWAYSLAKHVKNGSF